METELEDLYREAAAERDALRKKVKLLTQSLLDALEGYRRIHLITQGVTSTLKKSLVGGERKAKKAG